MADRGIRFAGPAGDWEFWPYTELAALAARIGTGLRHRGVRRGDVVALVQRGGPEFVGAFFGTLLAGATPAPVAPPRLFGDRAAYAQHVERVRTVARPAVVLADAESCAGLPGAVAVRDLPEGTGPGGVAPGPLALLQFTSGSTRAPQAVRIPYAALEANLGAMRRWVAMSPADAIVSWLPVHHDMGLIGCLLAPIVGGSDVWLLQPEDFIRSPARYLTCVGGRDAAISAMPAFGLAHIARRVPPAALAGLDLSRWRAVIVGAERIVPDVLDRFTAMLAPHGFRRRALLPAYGLAECTLAVTGVPLAEEWSEVRTDPAALGLGQPVRRTADGLRTAGCGRPLDGVTLRILDPRGAVLPAGHVGEIEVAGASVGAGYLGDPDRGDAGTVRTGDAGFLLDGQLFVLGRLGDALRIRGRALFAEDVEAELVTLGLPARRVAVVLGEHAGRPAAVALVERATPAWLTTVRALLALRAESADTVVLGVPGGAIPRTSSGKPRRRELWRAYCSGELPVPAAAAADSGGSGHD